MGVDSYNIVFGEKVTEFNGESYDNLNVNQLCNNNSDDVITDTLYNHSKKDRYCYVGKYSRFLGRMDEDYAYKVFIKPDTKDSVEDIFKIQNLLFKEGFSSEPYEIVKFNSGDDCHFAIRMENVRGTHINPKQDWVDKLCNFCESKNIVREDLDHSSNGWDIRKDCSISNCIQTKDKLKTYMIDIDWKWRQKDKMKTLVVIYNHNLPDMTNNLWEALYPHRRDDYDMMLIDNGSKPDGKSKYTTHETGQNTYFGGALNIALQYFLDTDKYDSLLSLNNDLVVQGDNFVRSLKKELVGDYKIVSPCVLQNESQCKWKYMHCWNSTEIRDVKWVDFQAPLLHRDFIEKIKQYPDELMYGWGQDALSGMICEDNGWKVGVLDWCPLIHYSAHTYKEGKSDLTLNEYCQKAEGGMFNYFMNTGEMDRFNLYRELSAGYSHE